MLDKHLSLNNLKEDKLKLLGLWYHRNCYSIFRNKEHVSRAEKLKLKARETQLVVAEEKGLKPQTPCHHLLRSSMPSFSGSEAARNVHKLPEICIICKKRIVYKMDKVSNACRTAILCFTEDHIYHSSKDNLHTYYQTYQVPCTLCSFSAFWCDGKKYMAKFF